MKRVTQSLRSTFRNRGRTFLIVTLLGVSLMFVAAMTSLSTNSQQELATVYKLVGTAVKIQYPTNETNTVQSGNPVSGTGQVFQNQTTPIPDSVITQVKQVPGVVSTQENLTRRDQDDLQGGTITGPNGQSFNAPVSINGISSDSSTFTIAGGLIPTLVSGRGFRASDANADVALVSQTVARANNLSLGSTITLQGTRFTVIGLYTTSNQLGDSSVIIPIAPMEKIFQTHGVDSITATAGSYEQVEPVAARLRQVLGKKFDVTTKTAQYSQVFSALQTAQQSIQLVQVISFIIAAVVIIFAVLQLVRERTAEIAILKALGSSHLQVLRQFWTEILIMSITAAALAILLLATLGPFIAQRFDIDPASLVKSTSGPGSGGLFLSVNGVSTSTTTNPLSNVHLAAATLNPQTLLIIVGMGIGLALLASFIPTWSVSTTKPAQVLRSA